MATFLLRRLGVTVLLLLVVSAVTFALQGLIPGDPARTILGVNGTEADYEQLRAALHLNEPLVQRYLEYMGGALRGDFGNSIFTGIPVLTSIAQRLPVSLALMAGASLIASCAGVLLGVWSATQGRVLSKLVDGLSMIGFALPNFWLALVLASTFALTIPIFPATGYAPIADGLGQWVWFLVLPWVALAFSGTATIAKVTRDSMMSTLDMDYIRSFRAAGVRRGSIIWKHGLRNAGIPVVTMVGLTMIHALAGTVFVESVFALPGLGSLAVQSINDHDVPVTQGVVLAYTLVVVVINFLVDIIYTVVNPRVRVS